MSGPDLELLVAPGTSRRIAPLARRLARWCAPRAPERILGPPVARLASSWRAPSLTQALADGEPPLALWVTGLDEAEAAGDMLERCRVVVTDRPEVAEGLEAAVVCPRAGFEPADHRPLTPFVRSRWRSRVGLAVDLVVDVRGEIAHEALPDHLVPTALALAASAVVDARWLDLALALGTAVVTDAVTADGIGATDGVEVVIATSGQASQAARALAGDLPRAAALGRAGRRQCERRHDLRTPAAEVARRLGLTGASGDAEQALRQRLGELWTPGDARVSARASAAVAAFPPLVPATVSASGA